jgi:hypothetical protein
VKSGGWMRRKNLTTSASFIADFAVKIVGIAIVATVAATARIATTRRAKAVAHLSAATTAWKCLIDFFEVGVWGWNLERNFWVFGLFFQAFCWEKSAVK